MGEKIALWIAGLFGGSVLFGKLISVFIISMLPIIELRGAIPVAAFLFNVEWPVAFLIAIIGNLLPVPFILFFVEKVFDFMKAHKILDKWIIKLETKAMSKSDKVNSAQFWGLVAFVAIPLPGTGAWTGSLIASLLKIDRKKSLLAVALGVLIAGIIVTVLTYGFQGLFL